MVHYLLNWRRTMKKFDVIIVGAGTSGMMATIAAAEAGAQVLLIEKIAVLGKIINDWWRSL